MEIDALLCDHAQVSGKLFISGANIDGFTMAATNPGPFTISFAVAGVVHVPWTETNNEHELRFILLDADGQVPELGGGAVVHGDSLGGSMRFNVGRPAGLPSGDEQLVPFAFQLQNLPFAKVGLYDVKLRIDGIDVKTIAFRILQQS